MSDLMVGRVGSSLRANHLSEVFLRPPTTSRVSLSTRVDAACFLHERLQLGPRHLAISDVPQSSRPFADRLVVDDVVRGAANDGSEGIRVLVDRQARYFGLGAVLFMTAGARFSPAFWLSDAIVGLLISGAKGLS